MKKLLLIALLTTGCAYENPVKPTPAPGPGPITTVNPPPELPAPRPGPVMPVPVPPVPVPVPVRQLVAVVSVWQDRDNAMLVRAHVAIADDEGGLISSGKFTWTWDIDGDTITAEPNGSHLFSSLGVKIVFLKYVGVDGRTTNGSSGLQMYSR